MPQKLKALITGHFKWIFKGGSTNFQKLLEPLQIRDVRKRKAISPPTILEWLLNLAIIRRFVLRACETIHIFVRTKKCLQ